MVIKSTHTSNHDSAFEVLVMGAVLLAYLSTGLLWKARVTVIPSHTQTEIKAVKSQVLFIFAFYESVYSVFVLDTALKMVGLLTAVM